MTRFPGDRAAPPTTKAAGHFSKPFTAIELDAAARRFLADEKFARTVVACMNLCRSNGTVYSIEEASARWIRFEVSMDEMAASTKR